MKCLRCDDEAFDVYTYCEGCCEVAEERYHQRQAWDEFHEEPCPETELTPYPSSESVEEKR